MLGSGSEGGVAAVGLKTPLALKMVSSPAASCMPCVCQAGCKLPLMPANPHCCAQPAMHEGSRVACCRGA